MKRVLVIGSPGAGKSILATKLAALTGLPLIHLDQQYWQPGWVEPDEATWQLRLNEIIAADQWIIDGNYGGSLALRLTRADTVIYLDYPAWLCVARLVGRIARSRGKVRPDMAEGCREQYDLGFLGYTASFRWHRRHRIEACLEGFSGRLVRLRRPAETDHFLAQLGSGVNFA